ncbi:MAG TPA: UDP-N-acetylmuramoyl-L-alanine--D-glutamate ligase [Acidimicrobiales bacterium]|nr:UDP-N-acetylmuramoyl-L-alanine--D-glutamate ligase [Acidimicrobiales bacterium]
MSSRSKISWSDLRGATVGVWGLGVEGRASVARLRAMGVSPVVVDDRPGIGDPQGNELPVLATHEGGLAALEACDVVVKAPGISRYRPEVERLRRAGTAVVGGLGLWVEEAPPGRVACVTGTKGKSTVSAVSAHLLGRLGYRVLLGGNIGQPPWDPAAGGEHDYWVVETSSFQATDLSSSPSVVAVTSLHPDHLDWHGDVETYYADKLSACSQPGADLTVAAGTSQALRERQALLGPRVRWVCGDARDPEPRWWERLGLPGDHNRINACIARCVLEALGVPEAADPDALADAAAGFQPLPSRLQRIGTVGGVDFVDDSLSTNALAARAALDTYRGRRVALLAGGHDRGIDYGPLALAVAARDLATLVVAMPDNGQRIADSVRAMGGPRAEVELGADLDAAVLAAFDWARPDGVVLLSPAAPSFGPFRDYRERAAAFAAAMRRCAAGAAGPATGLNRGAGRAD